ncbi:TetR/AcrR family transcriptional regulator [Pseudomonas yamanorum]|uniref:TetR/AcrR family transcriptional regulator n=1 Tax=Pseudomonas yamanorum TaxID=515393 RepID=UPI001C46B336|nr:TetR/AcrR family transcriptional regulator [Pseudomonas yamanorum]MBV6659729.1 TetR/AcrR family transcriptional regulator [Pseudomonas yamanorum]
MSKGATENATPASVTPLTRGHKKRERTRQGLVNAALRLFAQREVSEIALLEIAEEAQVSGGTIYNYFRTRDEVVEAVGVALATQFSETISTLSEGIESGARRLSIGVRMFVLRALDDPTWASAVIRVIHFNKAMRSSIAMYVLNDLRAGLNEGALSFEDESVALELVVSCAIGGMRTAVEGRAVPELDIKMSEMILKALGATPAKSRKIARMELPSV